MNCKKEWTRAHQNVILLPAFVNGELRAHQEQVMYEREMALFPTTIEVIEERRVVHRLTHESRMIQERICVTMANIRYKIAVINENSRLISLCKQCPKMYSDFNTADLVENNRTLKIQCDAENAETERDNNRDRVIRRLLTMNPEDRKIVMANHIDGADPAEILETLRHGGQLLKRARTQFIRACPIETCRGFLSQQWKCGLCNVFTCPKCNVPKPKQEKKSNTGHSPENHPFSFDAPASHLLKISERRISTGIVQEEPDEHVCNPDDIATAELLAKDTKPCPRCGTGIFKIDGCDQMWCTECKTAFNWRTGSLETGNVHNPHYFEYQRRIGADARNILDMPCNALAPDQYHGVLHHLIQTATNHASFNPTEREKRGLPLLPKDLRILLQTRATDYAYGIHDFADRILPRYRPDAIQNNQELRVQYLTEQITKEEFKSALSREAKQHNRKIEIGQVVQTVIFGMSDILYRLVRYLRDKSEKEDRYGNVSAIYCDHEPILAMFSEIDALIDYANECLEFISKQYKLTRIAIFVRNQSKRHQTGLFTVRVTEDDADLIQVRPM